MVAEELAGAALIAAGVALATVSLRRQSVLGALAALAGIAAAAAALVSSGSGSAATEMLGGSLVALVLGTGVFLLGQLVERAIDRTPDTERGAGERDPDSR
jgi:hypothetical protein